MNTVSLMKGSHLEEHYFLLSRNIYAAETILGFLCEWLTVRSVRSIPRLVSIAYPDLTHSHGTEVIRLPAAVKVSAKSEKKLQVALVQAVRQNGGSDGPRE
jgi:hypothetical protein